MNGALVLPIVHEVIPVNMNTLRLEVRRGKESALITRDRMRVDVLAEFYVRVQSSSTPSPTRRKPRSAHHAAGSAEGADRRQSSPTRCVRWRLR